MTTTSPLDNAKKEAEEIAEMNATTNEAVVVAEDADAHTYLPITVGHTEIVPTTAPRASPRPKAISTAPPTPTCKAAAPLAAIGCDGGGQ